MRYLRTFNENVSSQNEHLIDSIVKSIETALTKIPDDHSTLKAVWYRPVGAKAMAFEGKIIAVDFNGKRTIHDIDVQNVKKFFAQFPKFRDILYTIKNYDGFYTPDRNESTFRDTSYDGIKPGEKFLISCVIDRKNVKRFFTEFVEESEGKRVKIKPASVYSTANEVAKVLVNKFDGVECRSVAGSSKRIEVSKLEFLNVEQVIELLQILNQHFSKCATVKLSSDGDRPVVNMALDFKKWVDGIDLPKLSNIAALGVLDD